MFSAQGQFEASKAWSRWNWLLGGFTAAASGVAGVLTFATDGLQLLAGILALLAAASAAVHATLKPDKRAERAHSSATSYQSIQSAARRFRTIDVPHGALQELRPALDELAERADTVHQIADPIPGFAYRRAKRNVAEGGQTYEVDSRDHG